MLSCISDKIEVPAESERGRLEFDLNGRDVGDVEELILSTKEGSPGFSSIPTEVFNIFPKLEKLSIMSNLRTISSYDLQNAQGLTKLNLAYNQIAEIEPNTFNELYRLEILFLTGNKLTVLREGTFTGPSSLKTLRIDENPIFMIEDDALNLPNLESLNLANSKNLTTLSDNVFCKLRNLTELGLYYSKLTHVGRSLLCMPNLHGLFINNNNIQDIDLFDFAKLTKLATLYLSVNNISLNSGNQKETDSKPVENTSLKDLQLDENCLSNPLDLQHLSVFKGLEKLSLAMNLYINLDLGSATLKDILPNLKSLKLWPSYMRCEEIIKIRKDLEKQSINAYFYPILCQFPSDWPPLATPKIDNCTVYWQ